jgi:T5orf172 domain
MKSGNGTANPQFLYILVSLPLPLLCKIGISNKVSRRTEEVSKKMIGWAVPIFFVFIPFSFHLEQSLHRVFKFANVPFAGSREWFWLPVAPFAAMVMIVHQLFWIVFSLGLFFGAMWVFQGCPDEPVQALARLIF